MIYSYSEIYLSKPLSHMRYQIDALILSQGHLVRGMIKVECWYGIYHVKLNILYTSTEKKKFWIDV